MSGWQRLRMLPLLSCSWFYPRGIDGLRSGGTCARNWPIDIPSVSAVPTGEWIHFVAVLDAENARKLIYINVEADAVGNYLDPAATLVPAAHNVYIGARANADNSAPESFFNGAIDEVKVYERALSATEVLYLAGM